MEIWEEKYYSKEYGLETNASFRYFRRIITEFKPPFNLRLCAETFVKEEIDKKGLLILTDTKYKHISSELQENYISKSEYEKKVKSRHNTLMTYSAKFNYQGRFEDYYNYFVDRNQRNKLVRIANWEEEEIEFAMKRPSFANDSLQKIHNDEELSANERASAELDNQKTYKEAVDTVYTIFNGGKKHIETKQDINQDIHLNKSVEETVKEYEDYFKEFEQELEENTDNNHSNE